MKLRKWVLLGGILLLPLLVAGQNRNWQGSYNRIGLKAGGNQFQIVTDDLPTSAGFSWTAGFTTRSSFHEKFQFIYGISFFDFKNSITGREKLDYSSAPEEISFNMIGVQGNFFASYKIFDHFLSVEAGPVFQLNGKLDPRTDREKWYINGYDIQAEHFRSISAFNVNFAVGISGGFEKIKVWAQYQHGINNVLNGLNKNGIQEHDPSAPEFEGQIQIISAGISMFL